MIDALDDILEDLIRSRVARLRGDTQVGFEPPNDDWRTSVRTANEERLNLYLYDLRENTKLRSNARTREPERGWYVEHHAPPRLDCHYLVTAWSPANVGPAVEPTRDEHLLLYDVLEVLMRFRPLSPPAVYDRAVPSRRTLASVRAEIREDELPVSVALSEGVRQPGEFWSTMKLSWKPAIELTVTIPVILLQPELEVPMVTTLITDMRTWDTPETAEVQLTIGGQVQRGTPAQAVPGAWVQLVGLNPPIVQAVDQRIVADSKGRFIFSGLLTGHYRLRTIVPGLGDRQREVNLPSDTGEYDLSFP